jgi:hypothetical protein
MVTVIGENYYDTATLRDEDKIFDKFMNENGYNNRICYESPYTNFCTIWSWLFILKVPKVQTVKGNVEDGWVENYVNELFPEPPEKPPPEEPPEKKTKRLKLRFY